MAHDLWPQPHGRRRRRLSLGAARHEYRAGPDGPGLGAGGGRDSGERRLLLPAYGEDLRGCGVGIGIVYPGLRKVWFEYAIRNT